MNEHYKMCDHCKVAESISVICIGFHQDGSPNRKKLCSGCGYDATLKMAKKIKELQ